MLWKNDYFSEFKELLAKDDIATVHRRNLKTLAFEMYKISNDTSPFFTRDIVTGKYEIND